MDIGISKIPISINVFEIAEDNQQIDTVAVGVIKVLPPVMALKVEKEKLVCCHSDDKWYLMM